MKAINLLRRLLSELPRFAILVLLSVGTTVFAAVEQDVGPLDDRLTRPRNMVARNFGVWDGDSDDGGRTRVDTLDFEKNGATGYTYQECASFKLFHSQHIVRLPNKSDASGLHAYFMVSSSDAAPNPVSSLLYPVPNGRISLYEAYSVDPETDLVRNLPGADGRIIWEMPFDASSPIGAWNHPCKMELIGSLLLVCAQQWKEDIGPCRFGEGTDPDALLFFDVRDPARPRFWGRLTKDDLGLTGYNLSQGSVNDVSLFKAGDEWILTAKSKWWRTKYVQPDMSTWVFGGTGYVSGQHGAMFNSLELYDPPSIAPPGTLSPGTERVMWFDGFCDDDCGIFEGAGPNVVTGDEGFLFSEVQFSPPGAFVPSVASNVIGIRKTESRPAPNIFESAADYDACGIYITGGVPIIYSPLENYPYDGNHDKIYQISHPNNVRAPRSLNVTSTLNDGPGSLRDALSIAAVGVNRITFANDLDGATIFIDSPLVILFGDVTIDASGLINGITIARSESGPLGQASSFRIFNVEAGAKVVMDHITITNGDAQFIRYEAIAAGSKHTVTRRADGSLWASGINLGGQLGDGTLSGRVSPVRIGTDNSWAAIAAGYDSTMALRTDGSLWAWGEGNNSVPVRVGMDNDWLRIAVSREFWSRNKVALKTDRSLWQWGSCFGHQPQRIGTDNDWAEIAVLSARTVALKTDGSLWEWNCSDQPQRIGTDSDWAKISAGGGHRLALKKDDSLWAWGDNAYGQLGDGTVISKSSPVRIGAANDWAMISAGGLHNVALKKDGNLWAWGYNSHGQLGDGTTVTKLSPVPIGYGNDWVAIAAGGADFFVDHLGGVHPTPSHTVALKKDGSLFAWGFNSWGQLGNGTTVDQLWPTRIRAGSDDTGSGGGIQNQGNLTLLRCVVSDNQAVFGGGIANTSNAVLRLRQTTISGNVAAIGAGLHHTSSSMNPLTITHSTISGNSAVLRNNSIAALGGGFYSADGGPVEIENTTIANNTSQGPGAGILISGRLGNNVLSRLSHVTITGNRCTPPAGFGFAAGLYQNGGNRVMLVNSIVANNVGDLGVAADVKGDFIMEGANLVGNTNGGTFSGPAPIVQDPNLGPLLYNGGPTSTAMPRRGSPAIDAAITLQLVLTDQRGVSRPWGRASDLGAVERRDQDIDGAIVTSAADSGPGSLRQMIADVPAGEVITFAPNLSGQTIVLGGTQILLNKNLTIDASALPYGVNISGNYTSRAFEVASGTTVTLNRLTIFSGSSTRGGGIDNRGTLLLNEVRLFDNYSTGRGGGIYNLGTGTLTVNNSTLYGNTAWDIGGAIVNEGSLALTNSTLEGNRSLGFAGLQGFGGAIFNFNVPLSLVHCTLVGNSAASLGGGLRVQDGNVTIQNTIIAGNSATNGPDLARFDLNTTFNVGGANLIGDNATVTAPFPAGPLVGTTASPRDPRLARLDQYYPLHPLYWTDNGRYFLPIKPPLPGSPVIGAAVLLAGTPATDQRGAPRPAGSGSDLGAVEAFAFSTISMGDSDGDGIGDCLEAAYPQFTVGVNDRALDSDGDGSRDGEELHNMTDPNNPNDHLRIHCIAAGRNLLQDGGFELGLTTGSGTYNYLSSYGAWTTTQGTTAILGMPYSGMPPYQGTEAMHVGDSFGAGAVWQTFATTIGRRYSLSLAVIGYAGGPGTVRATVLDASNTNLTANFIAPGGNAWGTNNYEFVATSPLSTLRLQNTAGASTIDDVRVLPVVPSTGDLFDVTFRAFPGLAYELESSRTLADFIAMPGTQIVATTTNVTLPVRLEPDAGFVRVHRGHTRWATRVLGFSSQYTSDAWSAAQALGQPDTYPDYGDIPTAWASVSQDDQPEFLELGFDAPAPINSVSIYETYSPGAVNKVSVRIPNTGLWVEVWSGAAAPAGDASRAFNVTFPLTTFPVDAVRIDLNSPAVPDWNEIDAVSIFTGSP